MKNVYANSKLAFHENKVKALLEGKVTAPLYVRVKPTNQCDHHCFYCSYDHQVKGILSEKFNRNDKIPKGKIKEILSDFKDIGVKAITYSGGGEPLIYPYISETFEKTLEYGIDLSLITNGQNLNGRKAELLTNAKWVRISLGETNATTFSEVRKVPEQFFHNLINNIKTFAEKKDDDCELGINFAVHKKNSTKIYDSAKFLKELGVNHIKFTPVWTSNYFEYHKNIKDKVIEQINKAKTDLVDERFSIYDTYENDFELSNIPKRKYSQCYIMQITPVIGADSTVYFCHDKTYTKKGTLGSIKERSFKNLWFSEEAKEIFKKFNPQKRCNHHCTYDSRNLSIQKILNDLENIDKYKPKSTKHKNFI